MILRLKWVGLTAAGVMLLAAGCGSAGTTAQSSSSPVSTTLFKGKTITMIAPDKPGGGYDHWARLVAPFLGQYLGATVKVKNVDGAGTVVGTNELYRAKPDGLTLGVVNAGGDIGNLIEKNKGQKFDLTRFTYLAQPTQNLVAVFASPTSPYKTLQDLMAAKKPVTVVDVRSGVGDLTNRVVLKALGVPMNLLTGYSSGSKQKAGFIRGDGPVSSGTYASWVSLVHSGKAVPLLVTSLKTSWPTNPKVPTLGYEIQNDKSLTGAQKEALKTVGGLLKLGYDFAAPPKLSSDKTALLRKAFASILKDPKLIARAKKEGLTVQYSSGAQVLATVKQTIANDGSLTAFLKK